MGHEDQPLPEMAEGGEELPWKSSLSHCPVSQGSKELVLDSAHGVWACSLLEALAGPTMWKSAGDRKRLGLGS